MYCNELINDSSRVNGPYTDWAGNSNIPSAALDRFGNPQGSQYDLARDGAFSKYKIFVINLCNEVNIRGPIEALNKKGFKVIFYDLRIPSAKDLKKVINVPNSQLWVIANYELSLSNEHYEVIVDYFNSGHGLYVWSDNDPYYMDSNHIINRLFGSSMSGNYIGDKVISIQKNDERKGIIANHPISTGIQNFYEGITISNVKIAGGLQPLVYSSDGKVVTAYYDLYQKRALIDGGFTRLFCKWDSAGTDRYIVNAAAWLANIERFGYEQ